MSTIKYEIEFFSNWHCGSGLAAGADVDALVIKDQEGLPYIPGRTLKGLLREAGLSPRLGALRRGRHPPCEDAAGVSLIQKTECPAVSAGHSVFESLRLRFRRLRAEGGRTHFAQQTAKPCIYCPSACSDSSSSAPASARICFTNRSIPVSSPASAKAHLPRRLSRK